MRATVALFAFMLALTGCRAPDRYLIDGQVGDRAAYHKLRESLEDLPETRQNSREFDGQGRLADVVRLRARDSSGRQYGILESSSSYGRTYEIHALGDGPPAMAN